MFHWVDQRAPEPDRPVICPNCQSAIPVRRVLIAATPTGTGATLLACGACGARFFEGAVTGAYEDQPPGATAALAFYLQQGADMGGIAMRLIGLERPPGTRYLEIGCGFGLGLDIARRALGWDVKGIDPSPFAEAGRSELDLPIELRYFDVNAEPAAQFDVVHASEFLEHVPAPLDALRAMKRVLRAGGTLLLTTPAAEMIDPKTSDGMLIPLLSVGWHLVIQTADSLAMLLSRAGFDNVEVTREGPQLVARAGATPRTTTTDRTRYQAWLRSAATATTAGSDLNLGVRARLFRELAAAGDHQAADAVWSELNRTVAQRFGRQLESWCGASDAGPAPLEDLVAREPLCLAGVLLLRGWQLRQRGKQAEVYFTSARDASRRLRNALQAIGSDDGDAEDVGFAAERELIALAAERGEPGVIDRIVSLETRRGGRQVTELRRRCFVALVNNGRLDDAWRLRDGVAELLDAAGRMQVLGSESPGARQDGDDGRAVRMKSSQAGVMSSLKLLVRRALQTSAFLWHRAIADCDYLLATGDTRSHVVQTIEGHRPLGPRVCVYIHFDANGVVYEHSRFYLQALAEQAISIVFVSNSGPLVDESLAYVQRVCARILLRENRGYDFGGYRDAILNLGIEPGKFTAIVLANDSVYGPIAPLSGLLDQLDFTAADVWGASDSWQHRYHLQTYFMAFGPTAMTHPGFAEFWRNVRNVRSKDAAVHHYEIKLTHRLQAAGLRCKAVWDYYALIDAASLLTEGKGGDGKVDPLVPALKQLANRTLSAASARIALNPTSDLWLLLLWIGCPFIKKELLRHNPGRVPGVFAWHRVISSRAPNLYRAILNDLRRVARHIAP